MSKADKMMFKRGFKLKEIEGSPDQCMRIRYEDAWGKSLTLERNTKTISISIPYADIGFWLVINEKAKELGWLDE